MVSLDGALGLMAAMAVKHFCADFLFQTSAVARGKAAAHHWFRPLLIHALGHALVTLVIALVIVPSLWWIAAVELVVHAGIDRAKVLAGNRAKLDTTMPAFWWLFGFDQLLHQLTNVAIVGALLAGTAVR